MTTLAVVAVTLVLFGLALAGLGLGVMAGRRCLRGSCGGPEVLGPNGEPLSCATCPNRKRRAAR
ncbi:MAG TPA: hypothetical protein VLW45_05420 [Pelomicrobium sp.]|nr:hypothetical protein [Pelomicrobium sp.]